MRIELPHHPQDPLMHVAQNQDDFVAATHNYGAEHGVLWDRSGDEYADLRQSYSDLFNGSTGLRARIESLFEQHKFYIGSVEFRYINARRSFLFGNHLYRGDGNKGLTREFNELLDECPPLKEDIKAAVDRIAQYKNREASIWLLSDYPGSTQEYPFVTQQCHKDNNDTYYIQVGGAPLRLYPQYSHEDEGVYHPQNGDVVFMRGKKPPRAKEIQNIRDGNRQYNARFQYHAVNIAEWKKIGRLAFSIF